MLKCAIAGTNNIW